MPLRCAIDPVKLTMPAGSVFLLQAAVQPSETWLNWLKGDGRRMVLVYTPSGLGGAVAPELIHLTSPRRSGAAGWIEEGSNDRVTWMQMSYSYLESADPTKPPGVIPQLAPPKSEGDPDHNKVYEIGVGYAAVKPVK